MTHAAYDALTVSFRKMLQALLMESRDDSIDTVGRLLMKGNAQGLYAGWEVAMTSVIRPPADVLAIDRAALSALVYQVSRS